jgi:peptidoglycan DL-endopeptidase CwlO
VVSHRRTAHPLRTLVATFAMTVAVSLVSATPANADPSPAAIEAQIDTAWNTLETIIEQYNQVHGELVANQARAAALQQQLAPLQAQVDATMDQVSDISAALYKAGPASALNALLTSGSPTGLADQLTLLDMAARGQRQQISGVAAARDRYAADKKSSTT